MVDYITKANFKARHGITVTTNDARIDAHCTAASREVDSMCGRRFDPDSVASARYFFATSCDRVVIDDALEITAVAVDPGGTGLYDTTLTVTTDYLATPLGGIGSNGLSGWPTTALLAMGSTWFPLNQRPSVKVTAKWGWTAVPADIVEATYLIAHRLYYEVAVPSGVTSPNVEFGLPGSPLQRPYTVERLLRPFIRADRKLGVAG
jgi:hypothetical protein